MSSVSNFKDTTTVRLLGYKVNQSALSTTLNFNKNNNSSSTLTDWDNNLKPYRDTYLHSKETLENAQNILNNTDKGSAEYERALAQYNAAADNMAETKLSYSKFLKEYNTKNILANSSTADTNSSGIYRQINGETLDLTDPDDYEKYIQAVNADIAAGGDVKTSAYAVENPRGVGQGGTVTPGALIVNSKYSRPPKITNTTMPFDRRLYRGDLFAYGTTRVPFSSLEASPILSDLIDITIDKNKHKGHVVPSSKKLYTNLIKDPNVWGTLSLMNPYSVTRLYNGLDDIRIGGSNNKYAWANKNRMLDIRDQKRFYDIKTNQKSSGLPDVLSVSNPTTTNIIQLMCNDKWGRTPYTYEDFVFCKWWNKIPNNRMITLRKYTAPTYDNLCWELMSSDTKAKRGMVATFAPVATMVTYFGGETGNNLKDLFKIKSGLPWEEEKAQIWPVNGDVGNYQSGKWLEDFMGQDAGGMLEQFPMIGRVGMQAISLAKFFGMTKSPNAFDQSAANASYMFDKLHDPNENGPYVTRIKGPVNRIESVLKRKEGLTFEHSISLKFSYRAQPIGGINTKAVMLDIMSNILLMCSGSAVFWGGGHKFMIKPNAYPWTSTLNKGILKSIYNGKIFGKTGAINQTLHGLTDFGTDSETGEWSWQKAARALGSLGIGVLGALGSAINSIVGSISGQLSDQIGQAASNLLQGAANMLGGNLNLNGQAAYNKGGDWLNNIMANGKKVWQSNALKMTTMPYTEGMRSLLIGVPVGNWHLTIGNPLNPIAVIGNLCCTDVDFEFGDEMGPDDFPLDINCTVTLKHGMARDLAGIESMFNRGAGRIYQAPDYARMFGGDVTSDQETRIDAVTGGTSARVPAAFSLSNGATPQSLGIGQNGKKGYSVSMGKRASNSGSNNSNIVTPLANLDIVDYDYGSDAEYSTTLVNGNVRQVVAGNWMARKLADS